MPIGTCSSWYSWHLAQHPVHTAGSQYSACRCGWEFSLGGGSPGKKVEFSDTLRLREVSASVWGPKGWGLGDLCLLLRSCQGKWHFRSFNKFLTNCAEGRSSKRKQDTDCPFSGEMHSLLLEDRSGLCCKVGEMLAPSRALSPGKVPRQGFIEYTNCMQSLWPLWLFIVAADPQEQV